MKIVLLATTDLVFDQRLQRISTSLARAGYEVLLLGRVKPQSLDFYSPLFQSKRIKTFFWKGKLFYLEYNIRVFFFLLSIPFDVVTANDADTLLAGLWAGRLKGKKVGFDAHEYFSQVPELLDRPLVRKVWEWIENTCIPHVDFAYTPGPSLAQKFQKKYGVEFGVVRNMPWESNMSMQPKNPAIPLKIIYSGAVNSGRGLFELLKASEDLPVRIFIAGDGDVLTELMAFADTLHVDVHFLGYLKPDQLRLEIAKADLGVNLLTTDSLSYKYSLANKFFDYVQAGLPQLCVNYPEYESLNKEFEVAVLIPSNVNDIRLALLRFLDQSELYKKLAMNCIQAAKKWHWGREQESLLDLYLPFK